MKKLSFLLLGVLLACGDVDATDEELDETSSDLVNKGIAQTKLCIRMTKEATLYTTPTGNEEVAGNNGTVKIPAGKARYVLVQLRPGNVKGRVWADANLSGLTAASDLPTVKERCGLKSIAEAKEVVATAQADRHVRRGWMDVGALGKAAAKLESVLPNGPGFAPSDLDANGKPKEGRPRKVRANCTITQSYFGSNPKDPTGMQSYGTAGYEDLYVLYGTPEIDGGGITFTYVGVGAEVHLLRSHEHKQKGEHCQANKNAVGAICNGDAPANQRDEPMRWAEIWADVDGQRIRGWVPNACLELP